MDFFNRVGSTISNRSRDVARKAKELAEISSLNGQISTQENIIEKLCLEIGKTVYEKRDAFPDDVLAQKYTAVTNAYAEIEHLKTRIIYAKGAKQCPGCKSEVALDCTFCPDCGAAVPTPEPEPYVETIEIPPDSVIYYSNQDSNTP
ncbi:MAG: zinc ribbon domain-containing protein [Lachnospiraceae bacterium]|nr:zinc ribbon domain-containing protein [Lachnospiraceae bacterium]